MSCRRFSAAARSNPARGASAPASDPCLEFANRGDPCHRASRNTNTPALTWEYSRACFERRRRPEPVCVRAEWGTWRDLRGDCSRTWSGPSSTFRKWDPQASPLARMLANARRPASSPIGVHLARRRTICAYLAPALVVGNDILRRRVIQRIAVLLSAPESHFSVGPSAEGASDVVVDQRGQ